MVRWLLYKNNLIRIYFKKMRSSKCNIYSGVKSLSIRPGWNIHYRYVCVCGYRYIHTYTHIGQMTCIQNIELLQLYRTLTTQQENNPIGKWAKALSRHFTKEDA